MVAAVGRPRAAVEAVVRPRAVEAAAVILSRAMAAEASAARPAATAFEPHCSAASCSACQPRLQTARHQWCYLYAH